MAIDRARMQVMRHVSAGALTEPIAIDPVQSLRAALQIRSGGEHQRPVIAQRRADAAQQRADGCKRTCTLQHKQ
ncbi:hypothetical protein D3C73_1121210 [compost metagenome]